MGLGPVGPTWTGLCSQKHGPVKVNVALVFGCVWSQPSYDCYNNIVLYFIQINLALSDARHHNLTKHR